MPTDSDYDEACQTIRHYSDGLRHVRTLTIAQGFAILTAVGYLTSESKFVLGISAGVLGILITTVLYGLHKNYFTHVRSAIRYTLQLEEKRGGGVWTTIEESRLELWKNPVSSFVINKTIYAAFILALIASIFYSVSQTSASEKGGADQPANVVELKPEGNDEP